MEEYITLKGSGESILIEKKSRFIGHCTRVTSKEEAIEYINSVKVGYKDASHNVGAYNIRTGNINHSSDDGEPSGTAGVPVLETLLKANIVDAAVVVTRYFGGTLLGAGGLIRAYSSTASAALRDAKIVVMRECAIYDIVTPYPLYDRFLQLIEDIPIIIRDRVFLDKVTLRCIIAKNYEEQFLNEMQEFFHGTELISFIGYEFLPNEVEE